MTSQASWIMIDVSLVDTLLAGSNLTRPYIYTAFDESAQEVAAKTYTAMNTQHSIDFVNHVVASIPFSVHTVRTDRGKVFQGEFEQHLEKLGIRHELVISDRARIENLLELIRKPHKKQAGK